MPGGGGDPDSGRRTPTWNSLVHTPMRIGAALIIKVRLVHVGIVAVAGGVTPVGQGDLSEASLRFSYRPLSRSKRYGVRRLGARGELMN